MQKIRVGVIGLGMGRAHVNGFKGHDAAEVVAIADVNEERLKTVGDNNNIPSRYTDAEEMIASEKLDVISIATPNMLHKPLTLKAFEAGAHVFCEKPMALNAKEGREMVEAAKAAGKRLMINFSFRFTKQSWALKAQVDQGVLGDVYFGRTSWHRRRGLPGFGGWFGQKALSGGGPLIDLGVHRLDLALWLMGYPKPSWVMGSTYSHLADEIAAKKGEKFDVEDLAAGFIRFENGATLELEASWAANIAEQELMETRLLGTEGGLVQRNNDGAYGFEAEIYTEENGCSINKRISSPCPAPPCAMHHFIDAIVNDVPHVATGEEGLIVMELLDAIYESAESGKPVQLA